MHATEITVLEPTLLRVKFLFKGLKGNATNREVLTKFRQNLSNQGIKYYALRYKKYLIYLEKAVAVNVPISVPVYLLQKAINRL